MSRLNTSPIIRGLAKYIRALFNSPLPTLLDATYRVRQGIGDFDQNKQKNVITYMDYQVKIIDVGHNKSIFSEGKLIVGTSAIKYIMQYENAPENMRPGDLIVLSDGTVRKVKFVTPLMKAGYAISIEGAVGYQTTTTTSTTTSSTTTV